MTTDQIQWPKEHRDGICPKCNGEGENQHGEFCYACNGMGELQEEYYDD